MTLLRIALYALAAVLMVPMLMMLADLWMFAVTGDKADMSGLRIFVSLALYMLGAATIWTVNQTAANEREAR